MHMSIDGNSVAHSWHPGAMNGPVAQFNKLCFFQRLSMSYSRKIRFPSREQSQAFKAMFVLCLYATHSFIFVNMLNWPIEGNLTLLP